MEIDMKNFPVECKKAVQMYVEMKMRKNFLQNRLNFNNGYKYYKLPAHELRNNGSSMLEHLKLFNEKKEVKIYTAFPFCNNNCYFCRADKKKEKTKQFTVKSYLESLQKEISLLSNYLTSKTLRIQYVNWGGGTPTILSERQIEQTIGQMAKHSFINESTKFSIEADPMTLIGKLGLSKLQVLRKNKFNRISIGFQEMHSSILRQIGRLHSAEDNAQAINNARQVGFNEINVDLMYGLPYQTLKSWESTVVKVVSLKPDSVDLYRLRFLGYSHMYEIFVKNPDLFASEEKLIAMKIIFKEIMQSSGYREIYPGLFKKNNFHTNAHPYFCRTRQTIALGANGRGQIDNIKYYNEKNEKYANKLFNNQLPIRNVLKLSRQEEMENDLISGLCFLQEGIVAKTFENKYGATIDNEFRQEIKFLTNYQLLKAGLQFKLTEKGALFADDVFRVLCRRKLWQNVQLMIKRPQFRRIALKITKNLFSLGRVK